jgi:hypothetical protein
VLLGRTIPTGGAVVNWAYLIGLVYGTMVGCWIGWLVCRRRMWNRLDALQDSIEVDLTVGNAEAVRRQLARAAVMLEMLK